MKFFWRPEPARANFKTSLTFAGASVAVVVGGALYYSQIMDCPEIINQRHKELDAVQSEAVTSCLHDRKLLTALVKFHDARSTCYVNRMPPRESRSAPTPAALSETILELRQKIANACPS